MASSQACIVRIGSSISYYEVNRRSLSKQRARRNAARLHPSSGHIGFLPSLCLFPWLSARSCANSPRPCRAGIRSVQSDVTASGSTGPCPAVDGPGHPNPGAAATARAGYRATVLGRSRIPAPVTTPRQARNLPSGRRDSSYSVRQDEGKHCPWAAFPSTGCRATAMSRCAVLGPNGRSDRTIASKSPPNHIGAVRALCGSRSPLIARTGASAPCP